MDHKQVLNGYLKRIAFIYVLSVNFSLKDQIVNTFGFAGQVVSATTTT